MKELWNIRRLVLLAQEIWDKEPNKHPNTQPTKSILWVVSQNQLLHLLETRYNKTTEQAYNTLTDAESRGYVERPEGVWSVKPKITMMYVGVTPRGRYLKKWPKWIPVGFMKCYIDDNDKVMQIIIAFIAGIVIGVLGL